MSAGVFIAGTDTEIGKTRVTVALLRALQSRGVRCVGMKPVAAGRRPVATSELPRLGGFYAEGDMINDDVATIITCSPPDCDRLDINPYAFDWGVSPHIAAQRAGVRIEPEHVAAAYQRLATGCDVIVVEGTGGWFAPIGELGTMADIAQRLALPVVLVIGLRLGCLNHALLTVQAIGASGLKLQGWIGSVLNPDMPALDDNIAALDEMLGVPRLALLPHSRSTDGDASHLVAAASALFSAQMSELDAT
ncbi:MAG TPA: dethiobiotin synthase [Steroidobacteraceae bacterium]|jgi:dethiobiotin synthetase